MSAEDVLINAWKLQNKQSQLTSSYFLLFYAAGYSAEFMK